MQTISLFQIPKEENKQLKHSVQKDPHNQQPQNLVSNRSFVDLILNADRSSPDRQEKDDQYHSHDYLCFGQT